MDARDFSLWISALDGHQRLQAGDGRGHARHRAGVQDRSRVFAATGPPPCGAPAMAARSLPDPRRTHEYAPALRNQHGYPRLGGGKPPCGGAGRGGGPSPPSPPHRSRCPTPPHRGTPRRARAARTPRACPRGVVVEVGSQRDAVQRRAISAEETACGQRLQVSGQSGNTARPSRAVWSTGTPDPA